MTTKRRIFAPLALLLAVLLAPFASAQNATTTLPPGISELRCEGGSLPFLRAAEAYCPNVIPATPEPTATSTPEPTSTPTAIPTAISTPSPTATSVPTATPSPTP